MATRAISKAPAPDWRAAFRRSLRRAVQMGGALLLLAMRSRRRKVSFAAA